MSALEEYRRHTSNHDLYGHSDRVSRKLADAAIAALIELEAALTRRICSNVDEYNCADCKGHNRCEDEMDAGFGDYGRDDPREDR